MRRMSVRSFLAAVAGACVLVVWAQPASADTQSWCHAVISVNTKYGTMKNKRFLPATSVPAGAWKKVIDATLAGQSRFIAATPASILTAVKHEVAWFAKVRANNYQLTTSPAPLTAAEIKKIAAFEKSQCGISFAT
jgi:hypothetical protein